MNTSQYIISATFMFWDSVIESNCHYKSNKPPSKIGELSGGWSPTIPKTVHDIDNIIPIEPAQN
jgi:hypothetical protein